MVDRVWSNSGQGWKSNFNFFALEVQNESNFALWHTLPRLHGHHSAWVGQDSEFDGFCVEFLENSQYVMLGPTGTTNHLLIVDDSLLHWTLNGEIFSLRI